VRAGSWPTDQRQGIKASHSTGQTGEPTRTDRILD
jgi:hypothetical protein